MNASDLVLGVDGGGSKTVAMLAPASATDDKQWLGQGAAGPANPNMVGLPKALAELERAISAAFHDAGVTPGPVSSACVALAGGASAGVQEQLNAWAAEQNLAARFQAVHDALPVLAAGTPDGWGIAVISGTGSLVFGRDSQSRIARAGGWGHLFGDQGSGYAVAVAALRAVACAVDGTGPATLLTDRMMQKFGVDDPRAIVEVVYRPPWDRTAVAGLAEVVSQAADDADPVAIALLQAAAGALADGVGAVAGRLELGDRAIPLACAGGLIAADARLRDFLENRLHKDELTMAPPCLVTQPVLGAVRLARECLTASR